MRGVLIRNSLFFMLHDYFAHGNVENHEKIRIALIEKMQKMQCRKAYSDSIKAVTAEERAAAKEEYLRLTGEIRANALINLTD